MYFTFEFTIALRPYNVNRWIHFGYFKVSFHVILVRSVVATMQSPDRCNPHINKLINCDLVRHSVQTWTCSYIHQGRGVCGLVGPVIRATGCLSLMGQLCNLIKGNPSAVPESTLTWFPGKRHPREWAGDLEGGNILLLRCLKITGGEGGVEKEMEETQRGGVTHEPATVWGVKSNQTWQKPCPGLSNIAMAKWHVWPQSTRRENEIAKTVYNKRLMKYLCTLHWTKITWDKTHKVITIP